MAVQWKWDEKCGEATLLQEVGGVEKEFTLSLYTGNCHLIMLMEFEEDGVEKYSMESFWADKEHMKACLGLVKGKTNIHNNKWSRITKFRLNKAKCRYWKDIVPAVAQAFDDIVIELYTEE